MAGAAALTLATMIALVQGTILAVSIGDLPLRILAVSADLVLGTIFLLGCIYLATHLAVRILGVGNAEFPPNFLSWPRSLCRMMFPLKPPVMRTPAIPQKIVA